jgi:hypothetical protein
MTINNGQTQRHRQHWSQDTVERQAKPEITNNNGQPKDTGWSQDISLLRRFCFFPLPPIRLLPDVTISETRRAKQFCLPPICW